ncbi:MAG: hypothetical protein Q9165_004003 [Trypethelium subeluteriae]
MSTLYNLEPQPTAKVLLTTTAGDILLELFAKQTPLACRNFLQLCLDGYYDGTVFHRLVPGFIIQGGDPTGTGAGGESSYGGEPFADEPHSRLKFNRRGLLGMANTGKKDDNGSQFFLTLDKTEELQGRNTMFGRVVGDTIYNLMKMGDAELADDGGERPLYPTKITGAEILVNPFEDMVKRVQTASRSVEKAEKKRPKKKAAKNMLSFGGDIDDEVDVAPVAKKPKFNPKLVNGDNEIATKSGKAPIPIARQSENTVLKQARRKASSSPPLKPSVEPQALKNSKRKPTSSDPTPKRSSHSPSPSSSSEPEQVSSMSNLLSKTNAQIAELKASMKRNVGGIATEREKPKSALDAMIPATSSRGRKRRHGGGTTNGTASSREERRALSAFNSFREKLGDSTFDPSNSSKSLRDSDTGSNAVIDEKETSATRNGQSDVHVEDEEANLCDLHFISNCQSCSKWDDPLGNPDDEDFAKGGADWMNHSLSFAKDRLGKDLEWKRKNEEELVVIDPQEKEKGMKEGKKDQNRERGAWGKSAGRGREREKAKG